MTPSPAPATPFAYDHYELEPEAGRLSCHYSIGARRFTERISFGRTGSWDDPAVDAAARLVFLLAGVSYYKTAAPLLIDLGSLRTTEDERAFLRSFFLEGLGEFAYRNELDLSDLALDGLPLDHRAPVSYRPTPDRPLVPFGGGIDSIVTVEEVRRRIPEAALFVVSPNGEPFDAIERPAAATGLPVLRARREVDPQVLRSAELGFLNGHVPVTGILSAIAVMGAVLHRRDAVVMSNEWSASIGNITVAGRPINHQFSKSLAFERGFRWVLAATLGPELSYFSLLRPYSELWVARRFAALTEYHRLFRSCNRAFNVERSQRLDHWCGRCDKCCFIDLILAPFVPAAELSVVFDGREPLADPSLAGRFRALLDISDTAKPFECVGDVSECRAALFLAAARPDRRSSALLAVLADEVDRSGDVRPSPEPMFQPIGEHHIPDGFAPEDLLV